MTTAIEIEERIAIAPDVASVLKSLPVTVPVREKIAYGAGGVTDTLFLNFPLALAIPIFCVKMGMNPAMLGISMAIAKGVGALAAPWVGASSDNHRGRWGRRKPFMLVGMAVGIVVVPLLWFPPEVPIGRFLYVTALLTFVSVFSTMYSVPYAALGLEMSADYEDRTKVQAWRGYLQTIGLFAAAWFYWFCLRPIFGSEIVGVRWLSGLVVLVMLIGAAFCLLVTREAPHPEVHTPIRAWAAVRLTLRNRAFRILIGTFFILSFAQGCTGVLGQYVHIFYACHGDKDLSARISGVGGTLTVITAALAMPIGLWLARRLGKRQAAMIGIAISLLSSLILPWALIRHALG